MSTPLTHYQALEQTSARMAAAAQQGHWEEVERLQGVAKMQVQALKTTGLPAQSPAERQARLATLKAILRLDAQVRNLAEPGWVKVHEWLIPSLQGQVGAYLADSSCKP
jgi:hypothetical protein